MGWRDFRTPALMEKTELTETTPQEDRLKPFFTFIPPKGDSDCAGSLSLDHLTDSEREAYEEYLEIMTSQKFTMDRNSAEQEAMRLVLRAKRVFQARQAAKDYKQVGFVKIFSTVLDQAVYMAKNEQAARRVPDRSLPVYLESEVLACKGLDREEAMFLLEAKIIFEGVVEGEPDLS